MKSPASSPLGHWLGWRIAYGSSRKFLQCGLWSCLLCALLVPSSLAQVPQPSRTEITPEKYPEIRMSSVSVKDEYVAKIYLPESYFEMPELSYPVIYLTDGDRYFGLASDLVHAELGQNGIDVVLVGIAYGSRELNDEKRDRDFQGPTGEDQRGGSQRFLDFLRLELMPKLESEFRLDPKHRTLVGWSRGATFGLMTMFQEPTLFRNYVCLSPRLNYENWSVIETETKYAQGQKELPSRLFVSIGSEDERIALFPGWIRALEGRGYEGFDFSSETIVGMDHDLSALFLGLKQALVTLFHRTDIGQDMRLWIKEAGVDFAVSRYKAARRSNAEEYDFQESRLNELGYHYLQQTKLRLAISMFELNVETYPDSFNVYDSLGEALLSNGEIKAAKASYEKSLELNPDNDNARQMIDRIDTL